VQKTSLGAETFVIVFVRFLWTNRPACFTLDWMSGQSGISPVDQILRNVDLADIQDERARESAALCAQLPARWRPPVED